MTPEAILWLLAQWAIRATLLAAAAGALLWILKVKDASVRLAAWTAVLVGALLIPLAGFVAPAIPIPVPTFRAADVPAQQMTTPRSAIDQPEPDLTHPASHTASGSPATATLRWEVLLVALWAVVAAAMLSRLLVALRLSNRLLRAIQPIQSGLAESPAVNVPVTLGFVRPVILLPSGWSDWESWKLQAVLAHEQAHAERRDPLCHAASSVYRALSWFHPLAWWLHRHLAELAEAASDDAALRVTPDRLLYAETLISFFEENQRRPRWEGVAMARSGKATIRIERILDSDITSSRSLTPRVIAAMVISALPLIYLASSARPVWAVARDPRVSGLAPQELWKPIWTVESLQKPGTPDAAAISQRDFTGTWRIDPAKITQDVTEFPNAADDALPPPPPPPPPPAGQYQIERITRSGDLIRIADGGPGTITVSTIKLDGSEVQRQMSNDIVKTARSRLEDGKIITDWKLERHGKLLLEGHEVRSLSEDGDSQVVDRIVKSARQETKTHTVMERER